MNRRNLIALLSLVVVFISGYYQFCGVFISGHVDGLTDSACTIFVFFIFDVAAGEAIGLAVLVYCSVINSFI